MICLVEKEAAVKRSLFFVLLLFISSSGFAQDVLMNDVEWGEGSIILRDQTELQGQVSYNDKKGMISFEGGRESKVFVARQILGFEYYDHRVDRKRLFYSLEYEDENTIDKGPYIFELLKETKEFAVLQRNDPARITAKQKKTDVVSFSPYPVVLGTVTKSGFRITQHETIYLFPADGKVTPLLEVNVRMTEGKVIDGTKERHKLVNKELLIKCLGTYYTDVKEYAKNQGLDFEEPADLMKIFDYYQTLAGG